MRPFLRATRLRQPWLLPRHPRSTPQSLVPRRIATTCARNPAPVDLPRLVVKHGSKGHNSLATFIKYAAHTKLRPATPVFIGTHYEYTTALSLMRLGFSLLRTGAPNDAGIDLIGHWVLAPLSEPLPIIVQCKARQHTLAPAAVRELEGSFRGIPPAWKGKPVLGLLVTEKKATKGTLAAMGQSPWPMGFVMMSRHGLIQQFVWNRAASERGLQGVGVTLRHTPRALLSASELLAEEENEEATPKRSSTASKFANTGTQKDIQMTWMGSPVFTERNTLDKDTLDLIRLAKPKRSAGRPRKEIVFDAPNPSKSLTATSGRPRTMHLEPSPRGGQIDPPLPPKAPRPRGRPKGSKNKVKKSKEAD